MGKISFSSHYSFYLDITEPPNDTTNPIVTQDEKEETQEKENEELIDENKENIEEPENDDKDMIIEDNSMESDTTLTDIGALALQSTSKYL